MLERTRFLVVLLVVLVVLIAHRLWRMLRRGDAGLPHPVEGGGVAGGKPETLELVVREPWIGFIEGGKKTVEGRPCPPARYLDKVGQPIVFRSSPGAVMRAPVHATITAVRWYPSLEEYLKKEWEKGAPQTSSLDAAREAYLAIEMRSRDPKRDGAPKGTLVDVFGPKRVALRGGITAIEFSLVAPLADCGPVDPPSQTFAQIGQWLTDGDPSGASAMRRITNFLMKVLKISKGDLTTLMRDVTIQAEAGRSDGDIVAFMSERAQPYIRPADPERAAGRAASRVRDISAQLAGLLLQDGTPPLEEFLDVGCAEGGLTIAIAGAIGLTDPSKIHGCDILPVPPDALDTRLFTYTQACSTDLPYDDRSKQVMSCIMSLHHFHDWDKSASEVFRVLAPGGILVIREHDSTGPAFAAFLDVVHYVYAGVVGSEIALRPGCASADFEECRRQLTAHYRTRDEWRTLLQRAGFKHLFDYDHLNTGGTRRKHDRGRGRGRGRSAKGGAGVKTDMFRSYYGFFRKPAE
jgi:ubiquinone/menaquinone biosynthesis C-methylase UbiE/ASC-1-like (ASCH) protein